MKETAKRQFLLLGMVLLAAFCLSMYGKHGNLIETALTEAVTQQTETASQDTLMEKVILENEQAKEAAPIQDEVSNPDIRVLICSDNYQGNYHSSLTIQATAPFSISYGNETETFEPGKPLTLDMESPYLQNGTAILTLQEEGVFELPLLKRSQECPSYEGSLSVEKREEGLLLINTLPLETYLCYVVPSEMPSSYPMEALKAQAICARCYARRQIDGDRLAEFGADLDDSVSFQVYNNIGATDESRKAVAETAGIVMMEDGEIENALYYSTSCGIRIEDDMSEEAVFCSFLSGSEPAYESEEPWYRWKTVFSLEYMNTLAEAAYPGQIGCISSVSIEKRSSNGCAELLTLSGDLGTVTIEGEYQIRKFLQTYGTTVSLQDGSDAPDVGMLPSGFFYITPVYEDQVLTGFDINGGGYGHGNGMSQNGAKHMAKDGKSCEEILKYYYGDGVELICTA